MYKRQEQGSTDTTNFSTLLEISINTLTIAGISAIIIVFISAFLALTVNFKGNKIFPFFATAAGSGYAFPGVMIALGTTYFFSLIQNINFMNSFTIIGTFIALIFAYISRFNAIGYGSINTGIMRMTPSLMEASITMGYSYERSILKIVFPIIKPSFLVAGILSLSLIHI